MFIPIYFHLRLFPTLKSSGLINRWLIYFFAKNVEESILIIVREILIYPMVIYSRTEIIKCIKWYILINSEKEVESVTFSLICSIRFILFIILQICMRRGGHEMYKVIDFCTVLNYLKKCESSNRRNFNCEYRKWN